MAASPARAVIKRILDAGDDLYAVLGADASADRESIEAAFKQDMPQVHPGSCTEDGASRAFAKIITAFCILGDENLRKGYDQNGMSGVEDATRAFQMGELLKHFDLKTAEVDEQVIAVVKAGAASNLYEVLGLDYKQRSKYSSQDIDRAFAEAERKVLVDRNMKEEHLVVSSMALNKILEAYYVLGDATLRRQFHREGSRMISASMRANVNGSNLVMKLRARAKGERDPDDFIRVDPEEAARAEASLWDWQVPMVIIMVALQFAIWFNLNIINRELE